MVVYTKLRSGDWGVKVTGRIPRPGNTVEVRLADGRVAREKIRKVIWADRWVAICAVDRRS